MSVETVNGRAVTLTRAGSGPPLLYLHGLADVHSAVEPEPAPPLLAALRGHAEVIAPALPGYLGSESLGAHADVEDHAFHLADLLDRLELGAVTLVGASIGGWLAAEFAFRHPDRVGRLVLVDPLGLYVPEAPGALFFGAAAPRGVGGLGEVRGVLFADPDGPAARGALPDGLTREQSLRWFGGLAGAAQLGWPAPQLCNPKLRERLGRITAPTLLVWGRDDQVAPVAHADAWRTGLRDARVELVDEAGHAATLEQPADVAAAIHAFLT